MSAEKRRRSEKEKKAKYANKPISFNCLSCLREKYRDERRGSVKKSKGNIFLIKPSLCPPFFRVARDET